MSLRITPAILSLEAVPGATGEQPITIANEGDEPVEIVTGIESYQGASDDSSAVDWLTVEPAAFTLDVGESREATVKIEVPEGLPSGGRYALVTFTTGAGPSGEGSGASVAGKLGAAVLLVVDGEGDLIEATELVGFGPVLEPDGRVGFRALLRNTGNVHVRPSGSVDILGPDGSPYGRLEFPQERTVLPGNEAILTALGSLPVKPDGTYTASAQVAFGETETLTSEVTFAPTAEIAAASLSVCENLDRGPTLTATLENRGGLGLFPFLRFVIHTAGGNLVGDASPLQTTLVWGMDREEVSVDFPERLASGDYLLALEIVPVPPDAAGNLLLPPVQIQQEFTIGGTSGDAAPLCVPAGDDG